MAMEMEIKPFFHEHPLVLRDYNNSMSLTCDLCWRKITGPHYHCECDFDLHTGCTDPHIPLEIEHPDHPDHLLTFLQNSPHDEYEICNKCGKRLEGLIYHCSICKYDLHYRCAFRFPHKKIEITSNNNRIEIKSHKHSLILLNREALLLCDACGKEHRGYFYTCFTCLEFKSHFPFFIHKNCALLPNTFKHDDHDHPLNLSYSLPPQYSQFDPPCKICSVELNPSYWVYYCGPCRYFAHVDCATTSNANSTNPVEKEASKIEPFMLILEEEPRRKTEVEDEDSISDVFHLPVNDESVNIVSLFLNEMILKEKKGEKTATLEISSREKNLVSHHHHLHQHPLVLFDVQTEAKESCSQSESSSLTRNEVQNAEICNGCVQPISNSPFYRCAAQCNFFLHKCCFELPAEVLQHPCHPQHSLTLLAKSSDPIGWFRCDRCGYYCNGFTYHCSSCNLYLDVKCGLLPFTITHEAHPEHLLLLKKYLSDEWSLCNVCDYYCMFGFGCNTCNFDLHIECALLPRTIRKHKYDEDHPFVLTHSPVKDYPYEEYICEICEKELDPTKWFYHCAVCNNSLHIYCTPMGDRYANVKFGVTFDTNYHQHQLTLFPKAKDSSSCDNCDCPILSKVSLQNDPVLECSQCQFKLHRECIPKVL